MKPENNAHLLERPRLGILVANRANGSALGLPVWFDWDGAVLSMATDADGGTSLYVLDAKDMSLLARARSPIGLPAGFHGEVVADLD